MGALEDPFFDQTAEFRIPRRQHRGKHWSPFKIDDLKGGVTIVSVKPGNSSTMSGMTAPSIQTYTIHTLMYDVQHGCCGRHETLSHEQIQQRIWRGATKCRHCGTRAGAVTRTKKQRQGGITFTRLPMGTEIGGVRILSTANEGAIVSTHTYMVQHDCCGLVEELSHAQVFRRVKNKSRACSTCCHLDAFRSDERVKEDRGFVLVDELPQSQRPKPKIYASDIERHLSRVFGSRPAVSLGHSNG